MTKTLCIFWIIGTLFMPVACAAEETGTFEACLETIQEALSATRILAGGEAGTFSAALDEVARATDDSAVLRTLALNITQKVVYDRGNIQFLLADLETLAQKPYSAAIGGIQPSALDRCREAVARLIDDMKKMRPRLRKPEGPLTGDDCRLIVECNASFLTGRGDAMTTAQVWEAIAAQTKDAMPRWNKKYRELLKKIAQAEGAEPEALLTDDELAFARTFSRVRFYYFILSGV
ncbi:MAG: hypothetical protein JW844_00040 [Candidatus Omnitrophica bacterium]|nr:hypothetical protein [Candidatus Omnitrophota bacterium]